MNSAEAAVAHLGPILSLITKSLKPHRFSERKDIESKTTVSNRYKMLSLPVCSISMASKANNNSTNCDQTISLVSPHNFFLFCVLQGKCPPFPATGFSSNNMLETGLFLVLALFMLETCTRFLSSVQFFICKLLNSLSQFSPFNLNRSKSLKQCISSFTYE